MEDSALTPEIPVLESDAAVELEERNEADVQADLDLAALSYQDGWKKLADEMKSDIDMFRTGGFIPDPRKLSLEEVGKLFVIHQTVATFLQKYLDKVTDAGEAIKDHAERERTKR